MKQFNTKQMPKTTPGYSVAVWGKKGARLGNCIQGTPMGSLTTGFNPLLVLQNLAQAPFLPFLR